MNDISYSAWVFALLVQDEEVMRDLDSGTGGERGPRLFCIYPITES
jgi:hypothetical protein